MFIYLTYFLYLSLSIFTILFVHFLYVRCSTIYKRIKIINKKLSEQNISLCKLVSDFIYNYISYLTISFFQKYNLNVVKKDRGNYEINYVIDSRIYCIRVKKKKGPSDIIFATENKKENGEETSIDITDKLLSYMGPNEDFYGIPTTPSEIGLENITIILSNGEERTFDQSKIIHTNM